LSQLEGTVFIVDDDPLVLGAVETLIKSVGFEVNTFSSAQAYLESDLPDEPGCLVLDIRMPGLSGLDLQDEMAARGLTLPVIFVTGHGTVPLSVRAMKAGAVDFLQKPFEDQDLLDAVQRAIEEDGQARVERRETGEIKRRVESLTQRETQVLHGVAEGKLNKQIAHDLGLSENTVKTHRAHIMQKMQADSLADLIRLTGKAGILETSTKV
jgi:two-component system response regulator FixJ